MIDREPALYFRDQFRAARYYALEDSEGYEKILFVLERLGSYLSSDKESGLGNYKCKIRQLVNPEKGTSVSGFIDFDTLYDMVKNGRNDALHQGAIARIMTSHSVQLCIMLEDALMNSAEREEDRKIKDYMTRNPICAYLWQPMAFVRQTMLEYSFSYLPFRCGACWYVVSDFNIVRYLADCNHTNNCIRKKLRRTLECAIESKQICYKKAEVVSPDKMLDELLKEVGCRKWPIVVKPSEHEELVGIVTPFDLM